MTDATDAPRPAHRLLNARGVGDLLCLHEKTVRGWAQEGILPRPVSLPDQTRSRRALRWRLRDIEVWIDELDQRED